VDTSGWPRPGAAPAQLRLGLRELGFAVRRGETFPGLDESWVRVAVRDEDTTRALGKALRVFADSLQHGAGR